MRSREEEIKCTVRVTVALTLTRSLFIEEMTDKNIFLQYSTPCVLIPLYVNILLHITQYNLDWLSTTNFELTHLSKVYDIVPIVFVRNSYL